MSSVRIGDILNRVENIEIDFCRRLNGGSRRKAIRMFFKAVSDLGDGVFWYTLLLFLPYVNGVIGFIQMLHVLVTAVIALLIYKGLKKNLVRERPFIHYATIKQAAPALDRYSFPSGHTLHAFLFSILFSFYLPQIGPLVWLFTILVSLSRVILGLHYVSDVIAGALIGSGLAVISLDLVLP